MFGPSKLEAKVREIETVFHRWLKDLDHGFIKLNERVDKLEEDHEKMEKEHDEINKKLDKIRQGGPNHNPQAGGRKRTRKLKKRGKKTRKH